MWKCKKCNAELIGIYDLAVTGLWGKVDKELNIIEKDDMEDDRVDGKYFKRILKGFQCECEENITTELEFDLRAVWIEE